MPVRVISAGAGKEDRPPSVFFLSPEVKTCNYGFYFAIPKLPVYFKFMVIVELGV